MEHIRNFDIVYKNGVSFIDIPTLFSLYTILNLHMRKKISYIIRLIMYIFAYIQTERERGVERDKLLLNVTLSCVLTLMTH